MKIVKYGFGLYGYDFGKEGWDDWIAEGCDP